MLPLVGAILTLLPYPEPDVNETSKFVGAVTIKFAVKFVPDAVNV